MQWARGNRFSKHIACSYSCQMTALQECICIYLQRPNVLHGGNVPGLSQRSVGNAAVEIRTRGRAGGDCLCRGWRTPYIAFVSLCDLFPVPGVGNSPPIRAVPYSWDREGPPWSCCSQFPGSGAAPLALQSLLWCVCPPPQSLPRPCRDYCRVNICPPLPPVSDTIKVLI